MHSDQTILITGCSSGIGYRLALDLHRKGYQVIASCRDMQDIGQFEKLGIPCLHLDLDNSASIENAVSDVLSLTRGRVYGLINNAAYGQPGALEDLSRDALRSQFETNVLGTQELTNLILPLMRASNSGRIIQVSSILGFMCLKYRGAYNASKYALEALSDTLRLELADTKIRVSLIEPGPITSNFRTNALQKFRQHVDPENSPHREDYLRVLHRLESEDPVRFNLSAGAILKPVLHALHSTRPRVRYPVTVPTRIMGPLKRLLPDRALDQLLARLGD